MAPVICISTNENFRSVYAGKVVRQRRRGGVLWIYRFKVAVWSGVVLENQEPARRFGEYDVEPGALVFVSTFIGDREGGALFTVHKRRMCHPDILYFDVVGKPGFEYE